MEVISAISSLPIKMALYLMLIIHYPVWKTHQDCITGFLWESVLVFLQFWKVERGWDHCSSEVIEAGSGTNVRFEVLSSQVQDDHMCSFPILLYQIITNLLAYFIILEFWSSEIQNQSLDSSQVVRIVFLWEAEGRIKFLVFFNLWRLFEYFIILQLHHSNFMLASSHLILSDHLASSS